MPKEPNTMKQAREQWTFHYGYTPTKRELADAYVGYLKYCEDKPSFSEYIEHTTKEFTHKEF